ncbi:MAG: PqqD family peptide modification chaperone [Pyrinomonadaceae bacterium]
MVVTDLQNEVVIYDRQRNKAFCLNHTAALVWKHADGATPVAKIAERLEKELKTPVDETLVWYALRELEKDGLLEPQATLPLTLAALSRRELIKTIGNGAAIAIPLVILMGVPSAAQGQYPTPTPTPRPGGCVLPETPIAVADGSLVPAREVVVGQSLLGVDTVTGAIIAANVKEVFRDYAPRVYELATTSGEVLRCSPTHPLIAGYGAGASKRAAADFKVGDTVLVHDAAARRAVESSIAAIEVSEGEQSVMIYEMASKEHTYISGGIVSHNAQRQKGNNNAQPNVK